MFNYFDHEKHKKSETFMVIDVFLPDTFLGNSTDRNY